MRICASSQTCKYLGMVASGTFTDGKLISFLGICVKLNGPALKRFGRDLENVPSEVFFQPTARPSRVKTAVQTSPISSPAGDH